MYTFTKEIAVKEIKLIPHNSKDNDHSGHRSRLRDRVRREGLDSFYDYQALEYVLTFVIPYKDVNPLAHSLINHFGSFAGVFEASEKDLMRVSGMGEVTAHFLTNLKNIFTYYERDKARTIVKITNTMQTYQYVCNFLRKKLIEEMYVICLTAKNKIICVEKVSEGTANEASISMRLISQKMSDTNCSNIIIAHNHPSGDSTPSDDDDKFTKGLITSLSINGCHLMDHMIIGENGDFYSYRNAGLLDTYKSEVAYLVTPGTKIQPCAKYEVLDDKE